MNRLERGLLCLADEMHPVLRNSTASGGVISPSSVSLEQFSSADAAMKLSAVSSSARRAWVEISTLHCRSGEFPVALREEGVD